MFKLNCYQNPVVVTAKAPPAYAATLLPLGENPLLDLIFVYWLKNINIHIYSIYIYMHIHTIHLPGTPMIFIWSFWPIYGGLINQKSGWWAQSTIWQSFCLAKKPARRAFQPRDPTHVVLERRWQRVFCPLRKPSENSWVSSRYPVCLGLISMFDVGILFWIPEWKIPLHCLDTFNLLLECQCPLNPPTPVCWKKYSWLPKNLRKFEEQKRQSTLFPCRFEKQYSEIQQKFD